MLVAWSCLASSAKAEWICLDAGDEAFSAGVAAFEADLSQGQRESSEQGIILWCANGSTDSRCIPAHTTEDNCFKKTTSVAAACLVTATSYRLVSDSIVIDPRFRRGLTKQEGVTMRLDRPPRLAA